MYQKIESEIEKLTQQVAEQAESRCAARRLMTHPGVGPVTALAMEVFPGDPRRFVDGKALASYVGIIPREYSSGGQQRLGGSPNKVAHYCAFSGVRPARMRSAAIQS